MSTLSSLKVAASGLTAQRLRMDVIAANVANAETTRTPSGGPYRRTRVVFTGQSPSFSESLSRASGSDVSLVSASSSRGLTMSEPGGVSVTGITTDPSPNRMVYQPGHPDADEQGYVAYPNVDVATEMADMLSATRAYEANVTVLNAAKSMAQRALDIGRG